MGAFRLTAAVLALLWGLAPAHGRSVVIPIEFAGQEGGSDTASLFEGSTVIQTAYGESLLTALRPGQKLTGMQLRANGNVSQPMPLSNYSFINFDVSLSTSPKLPGSLSATNFASNLGVDVVKVRSGSLSIPAGSFPATPSPGPEPFGPFIPFTTPFTFRGGTLLLEIRARGDSAPFLTDFTENLGLTVGQRLVGFSYFANGGINLLDCVDVLQFQVIDPEDLNGDGSIDAADAGIMFSVWGSTQAGVVGDLNGDRVVDAADAGLLFAEWTGDAGATGDAEALAVPEPANGLWGGGLLGGSVLAMMARHWRPSRTTLARRP